jgi:Cu/Zn superoxide dismutase
LQKHLRPQLVQIFWTPGNCRPASTIGKSSSMLAAGHVEADQQHVAPPSRPSGTGSAIVSFLS